MPRQYQRELAVAAVLGGRSLRKAASDFGVNYKTLQRYVKLHEKDGNIEKTTFGYTTQKKHIFSDEQEQILLNYILEASSIYYGLTLRELRNLAYEVAEVNKIPMPKSWTLANAAGEDWLTAFRQRHSDKLSLRKTEATSLNRAQAFNKTDDQFSKDRPAPIPNRDEPGSGSECQPSKSGSESEPQQPATTSPAPTKSGTFTSPKEIRPFPKAPARIEGQKKRKAVMSAILTSTPEKLSSQTSSIIIRAGPSKPKKLVYDSDDDDEANIALENILSTQMDEEDGFEGDETDYDMVALQSSLNDAEVNTISVGDFGFFKCEGKKSTTFYTGIVKNQMDAEGDFEVEYLKKSEKVKNKFVHFPNDETWSVHKKDIILKLTKSETRGTQRTKSGHVFIEDIVKYAA